MIIYIQKYNPKNKFSYYFGVDKLTVTDRIEVIKWLKENCGKYNQDYIYWALTQRNYAGSGAQIYFMAEDNAAAFKLTWF